MINIKMGLAGVVLVGLIGSGTWFAAHDGPHARAQIETIQKPALPNRNIEAELRDKSYCLVPGQTTVIAFVPNGSLVKKGDLVCELDSAALWDQLVNQKITLKSAEANLENAKLSRETAEIAVVEYEQGIYQSQLQETEGNIKIAEAEWAFAVDRLTAAKADRVAVPHEIKLAELGERRARFAFEKAQSRKKVLVDFTGPKKQKALKSAVEKARADELARKAILVLESGKEKKLERGIAACRVVAPRDGKVQQLVVEGTIVRERRLLFEIIPTPVAKPESQ